MSNPNDITYYFDQEELKYHIMIINWIGAIGISLVSLSMPLCLMVEEVVVLGLKHFM